MLRITVPETECFDEATQEFKQVRSQTLTLEHSLVSISKWEAKWHIPFLDPRHQRTNQEMIDYIRCMTLTQNVNPEVYLCLTADNLKTIQDYIDNPMTATWFSNRNNKKSREIITSEIIYYWMISLNIPVEFQKWHLNRLMTLIEVCVEKNKQPKKMSKAEAARRQRSLNSARRKARKSRG